MRRRILPLAGLVLLLACQKREADTPPQPHRPADASTPEPSAKPDPTDPAAPLPDIPLTLEAYLAATPAQQPVLPPELTGIRGDDPETKIPRCSKTGWSYHQCDRVYPMQGRTWVRWECVHGDDPTTRSILCTRLAEYLLRGVGGPTQPKMARELFDRQCQPDDPQYRHNCHVAARTLMFEDAEAALGYARKACDSHADSPIGCKTLLPALEAGISRREITVETVEGLDGITTDGACTLWTWPDGAETCGARLACGDRVLYGEGGSTLPCKPDGTASETMTTGKDGDPAIQIDGDRVELRDDETGRFGAFTLAGRLK